MAEKQQTPDASGNAVRVQAIVRKPRHRWFVHHIHDAEDNWRGPFCTIDAALAEGIDWWPEADVLFVAQGHRTTRAEREEWGVDFAWQIDTAEAIRAELPNKDSPSP